MAPRDKIGLFYTKYLMQATRTFRCRTGLPVSYGYLRLERISSSIVSGTIREEDLKKVVFGLSFSDLAQLKILLKDFDARLLTWKSNKGLDKRERL